MPKSKTKTEEKLVTHSKSVHVVFFSCPDCGEEESHVQFCSSCGNTMRVIDVVEKFGEEAEEFLKKVEKAVNDEDSKKNGKKELGDDEPNIILMGDNDEIVDDPGIDPNGDSAGDEDKGLDVIFPSDDDDDEENLGSDKAPDDDLTSALELLDAEEEDVSAEDFGFDGDEIPEL